MSKAFVFDKTLLEEVAAELNLVGKAMGQIAVDDATFREAIDAFRAADGESFQRLLARLNISLECERICSWIRVKECVLECIELCGPPKQPLSIEDIPRFAEVLVKITSDEELVEQLADSVREHDVDSFKSLVSSLKIERFCHLLCSWACAVRGRLLCRVVCGPVDVPKVQFVDELTRAGAVIGRLVKNDDQLKKIVSAAAAFNCEVVRDNIGAFDDCLVICEWICSWRCVLSCLSFCVDLPLPPIKSPIDEMRSFAMVSAQLAEKNAYPKLLAAMAAQDAKTFKAILREFKVEAYCFQICRWICFELCRRFCICICPPVGLLPQFTALGGYQYLTDINSGSGGNGLTVSDSRAFYSVVRLNGILTQTLGGKPMEYRFETQPTDAAGNPTGPWKPVLPGQIARTVIGLWEHFTGGMPPIKTKLYTVNGVPGPNELVATISVDGWIKVPQENNVFGASGAFFANGNMIELSTQSLAAFAPADETGVKAGSPAAHPLASDLYFGIRMRVRQQGIPASETDGGTCVHVAIDNTLYDNINHHPEWDGGVASGQLGVAMVDIKELLGNGCADLGNSLTVLFTAAHPNLGPVSIVMTGPGGPYNFSLPLIPETGDWYGKAAPSGWKLGDLKPCAYLVTLAVTLLLTTGDSIPNPIYDQIAFCKT